VRLIRNMKTAVGMAVVAGSLFGASAMAENLELKMSGYYPESNALWPEQVASPIAKIAEVTNGRVKIKAYPSNTLVAPKDVYRSIQTGLVGVDWVFGPFNPGAWPLLDVVSLPGLFPNQSVSNQVLQALFKKHPEMEQQFPSTVKHIVSQVHMRADLHSRMPISTLADLKGKVIGCQSPSMAQALAALGASSTVIKFSEAYTSLERGVLDGVMVAWGSVGAFRLDEVAKNHTMLGLSPGVSHWMFNRKDWDKISKDDQMKIELLAPELQATIARGNIDGARKARVDLATAAKGHKFFTLSDQDTATMREKFRPLWNEWADKMEAKGLPGKAVLKDAEELVLLYSTF
jgi:TRAP-type C4-dicarboxylate transport system substrate-binding protein